MRSFFGPRILGILLVLAGAVALSYNVGVANGLAQAGAVAVAAPVAGPYLFFGAPLFGFFFFGFLFKLLIVLFLIRLVLGFFRGGHRGPWGGRGDRRGSRDDASSGFEEWHRRAHDSSHTVGPL